MFSKNEENQKGDDNTIFNSLRRAHKFKSLRVNQENVENNRNKYRYNRLKSRKSVENDTRKVRTLIRRRSSKSIAFNIESNASVKDINQFNEEFLPDIIDPSYNFTLNYQMKETAINVFKSGIDKDKTKLKFFSNFLYQLKPFNKIFAKIRKSKNMIDIYNLQRILISLSTELFYEYFDSNKIIYRHGDIADKYYILLRGEVDVIVPNEIEVMMNEYEYFFYILRLYKFQEFTLLKKVLNKNYNLYPLNKKLLEDWIQTAYNTLRHLKNEEEFTKIVRKRKKDNNYITSYDNAEELFNQLEKRNKLNLLMKNKNVIILLEKIRMKNERMREASKNRGLTERKKEKKKKVDKNKKNNEENNYQPLKQTIGYTKLDGQLKKIFLNDDQIEVVEKCANEITRLIEILSEGFNMRKYLFELNRCNSEKYLSRVEPYFFDEDTNEKLDSKLFLFSRNQENNSNINKESLKTDDIRVRLQYLFNKKKVTSKEKRNNELFQYRKRTIVYHYVLVNTISSGDTFGETSNESMKKGDPNLRIATIIARENSDLASLKKYLYNKILKEINENNLHQQLSFLFSLKLFKECNKNNFMKNYLNFFIRKTFRANEILFNQDENLGDDRSIYFIEEGAFSSYCNMSVNDIEILFNSLNYEGLIPVDDAHEDNLFNKENHYFNQFKKKKIIFNLLYFTENDIIGFNDALCNGKYIYTVKCQTSFATVYEIKLKFFNLIINSEEKLYKNVAHIEMVKRNLMIKLFLNAFNNKSNFYKFISFNDKENDKNEKNIIHKNYFGKNPFRDTNEINNNANARSKTYFKTINKINDHIQDKCMTLMPQGKRVSSPNIKNYDSCFASILLNNKIKNNIKTLDYKNKILFRNKNKISMKNSKLSTTKSYNFTTKESYRKKGLHMNIDNNDLKNKTIHKNKKTDVKNKESKNNNSDNSYELKIEEYQTKPKNKNVIPPIITNQINKDIHLYNKNNNLFNSLFEENIDDENINKSTKIKYFYNHKNEISLRSSNFIDSASIKPKMKSVSKSMNKYKKYLDSIEDNIILKYDNMTKEEEMQLKCYLKEMPDFFNKDNCKKNIFFGMNKKTLFQNNVLFTEFK